MLRKSSKKNYLLNQSSTKKKIIKSKNKNFNKTSRKKIEYFLNLMMIKPLKSKNTKKFYFNKNYQTIENLISKNGKTLKITKESPEFELIEIFLKNK